MSEDKITAEELKAQKEKIKKLDEAELAEIEKRKKERAAELEKVKAAMEAAAQEKSEYPSLSSRIKVNANFPSIHFSNLL